MIAVRTAAPLLLALLSLAACADDSQSGMSDKSPHDQSRTGQPHNPDGQENAHSFAKLACDITVDGHATSCHCISSTAPEFCKAGLDFVSRAHYQPGIRNGVAVRESNHTITVNFWPNDPATLHPSLIRAQSGRPDFSSLRGTNPPVSFDVAVHCMVMPNGLAKDCSAHSAWAPIEPIMALYASHARYIPATSDGTPVAAPWDKTWHLFATQVTPNGFDN